MYTWLAFVIFKQSVTNTEVEVLAELQSQRRTRHSNVYQFALRIHTADRRGGGCEWVQEGKCIALVHGLVDRCNSISSVAW